MAAPISSSYPAEAWGGVPGGAREWFGWLLREAEGIERDRARLDGMREALALSGAGIGAGSGGSGGDFTDMADAVAHAAEAADRRESRLALATATALRMLYGPDGLARSDAPAADCICVHYLERRTWAEVAERYEQQGVDGRWCRTQAERGFRALDRLGAASRA